MHSRLIRLIPSLRAWHISIAAFAVLSLLFLPSVSFSQPGEGRTVKKMGAASEAFAYWLIESQDGNVVEEFILRTVESKEGIDVFATRTISDFINNNFEVLSGHTFLDDRSAFDIDNRLNSATLPSALVEICSSTDQDENGGCIEAAETLAISAEWTATSAKTVADSRFYAIIDLNKILQIANSESREAVAEATVNGKDMGTSNSASMLKARSLEIITETSRKVTNFGALGNKGFTAANAMWEGVTIDGESALVVLRATKAFSDGSVQIYLQLVFSESGRFLDGELNIPGSSKNSEGGPLNIDRDLASAELEPVAITVCAFELDNECSDPESEGRAEYLLHADWEGVDDPVLTKLYFRSAFEGFVEKGGSLGITTQAEATGSLGEIDLEESKEAAIFHLVLS